MTEPHHTLAVYLHLARASELRRRWLVRDKLLLICAMQAHTLELDALAAHCRQRLLAHNSGHLVGRFADLREASLDDGFAMLLQQAERTFSREKVEYMLQSLGVELGRSEETYATPEEYLQSILGPTPRIDGESGDPATVTDEVTIPSAVEPKLSAIEIAANERREFNYLLVGIASLTIGILVWGGFLSTR